MLLTWTSGPAVSGLSTGAGIPDGGDRDGGCSIKSWILDAGGCVDGWPTRSKVPDGGDCDGG